jgi:nucleotide-binding universal stress UspA family protein
MNAILIAVDDSPAALKTLEYVAKMTAGREDFRVLLLHLLPLMPPDLLEHGGAEDPLRERELERELRAAQTRWIQDREREAEPVFDRAREILEKSIAPERIETECRASVDRIEVARDCVEAARERGCDTIAIGREALPWHRELVRKHMCDELVRHADGLTVWVVAS